MQNLISQVSSSCSACLRNAANPRTECSSVCAGNSSLESGITNPVIGDLNSLTGEGFFQKFIPSAIGLGFVIGVIIFFFVLLLGAIQWISSGGDKAAVEAARSKLSSAIIGLVVLFSIFAIIKLIEEFFGLSILTLDIGPLKIQ